MQRGDRASTHSIHQHARGARPMRKCTRHTFVSVSTVPCVPTGGAAADGDCQFSAAVRRQRDRRYDGPLTSCWRSHLPSSLPAIRRSNARLHRTTAAHELAAPPAHRLPPPSRAEAGDSRRGAQPPRVSGPHRLGGLGASLPALFVGALCCVFRLGSTARSRHFRLAPGLAAHALMF